MPLVSGVEPSSSLNVNAMEFVPSVSNSEVHEENANSSTGTVSKKKFYDRPAVSSNGSNSRREKFFRNNQSRRRNGNYRDEQGSSLQGGDEDVTNKKFFANNQRNARNGFRSNNNFNSEASDQFNARRNDGENYFSRRNRQPRDRENDENRAVGPSANGRHHKTATNFRRTNNFGRNYDGIRSSNNSNEADREESFRPEEQQAPKEKSTNRQRKAFSNRKKETALVSSASQRDRLIKEIETNALECMICCEKIKSYQPVWNCVNCYHIIHLNCIKTWMKNSKNDEGEWRCPACNNASKQKPGDYTCFCGKLKNPPVNRNDLAHSCGNMCLNIQNCPHPCQISCHPGPHETCYASVMRQCGCGKSSRSYQCSMKATFECDSICDKILNCSVHKCTKNCHQGECENCDQEIESSCFCGSEIKKLPCTVENICKEKFACEKECEKTLSCGNHKCTRKCHEGDCGSCKLLPELTKRCPCGKTPIKEGSRLSCTDPIPVCESTCRKALNCGKLSAPHTCAAKCHLGPCPPCNQKSSVKCRCGKREETIWCKDLVNSDLRCKKKCNKFKSCGRHRCNIECCIDPYHTCAQNCNRQLNCKLHKCQRTCHVGNCSPCHRVSFDELHCECGTTIIYPPVPCNTRITECPQKCKRPHKCSHPVGHTCHSEPECPPCVFLTTKFCYGKHEERKTIPCNQDSFSCGMPCGKLLKCKLHNCIRVCHQGDCEKAGEVCKQKCTVKRTECAHNCNASCHDGECPNNVACREKVGVSCKCGNLKDFKTCEQVEYENKKLQRVHITLQMQQMQNDEINDLKAVLGDFKKTTKILECNEECKILERNRRLDIAFKVQNPTLATTPRFITTYSDHVRNFYKKDPSFVNMVHEKLTELVKVAKESKAPYRCHSFPSMNRDKRHVIHDMAELFGVETKAYDAEPNRNIVATATRETSWLPSMSVAEVASREQGARRPPSNQIIKK